jgi:hypothetical protein
LQEILAGTVKRPLLLLTLILALAMPALLALGPAQQSGVEMTIAAGYNGFFRGGQWIPVQINATNRGDDITGEVRVRTGDLSSIAGTTYSTPLDLPRDSRKQVFLYVSLEGFSRDLQVELVDNAGNIVRRASTRVRVVDQGDVLYAVITQSPLGAVDLTGVQPGIASAHQVTWQPDDLPPLAEALAGLDVMMFHDVDTGALSTDQVRAVERWVRSGGHLIVTGGDTWQRTTAAFQEILPATLQGTAPLADSAALAEYLRTDPDGLDVETTVTRADPAPGARVLVYADDRPLIVRGTFGSGTVDFLAFDPQAEPVRSWSDKTSLWAALITSTGQRPSWAGGFSSWSIAREATLTTTGTVLPTFLQLCGFLTLYIVLVGPANYLILRRLNRRELAWVTIPLLIAIFSVLAYTVGFNLRGNVATINRLSVARLWPDSDEAEIHTLIGVHSPRRTEYDIAAEPGTLLRTLPGIGNAFGTPVDINESVRTIAEGVPIDAGTVSSFAASGFGAAPEIQLSAEWDLTPGQSPSIRGTVVNTSDITLEDAVVIARGASHQLGTLPPGARRSFTIAISMDLPGPLALGSPYSPIIPFTPGWQGTNRPGWCFSPEGLYLTLPDVIGDVAFPCRTGSVSPEDQEIRRRYRLLGALIVDRDESGGRGAGVTLFAWAEQPLVEIDLLDRPQDTDDTTLYIAEFPVTVRADVEAEIPPALTTWTTLPGGVANLTPLQFQLTGTDVAEFQFLPLPEMRLDRVSQIDLYFDGQGRLNVEIWDWESDLWRPVALDPNDPITTIGGAARYAGPENAVNVRVSSADTITFHLVDYVKVGYRGSLAAPASRAAAAETARTTG